jgi:BirA family biotin operon repressor/biotin-[acetyl-CoA-carboxylase] ligase
VMHASLHASAHWLGCQRIELDECGSTNDEAARLARAGAKHGTVVIAAAQSAGRGREGRSWQSPQGGLYLSAVLRPNLPASDVPPITLAIGIGVCDAVRVFGAAAQLKWPNDVLVAGKKLSGVLVETQSHGPRVDAVIVGIGVNLDAVPPEVSSIATSLAEASATVVAREVFISQLLVQVERWVDRYTAMGLEAVIPAWQDRMAPGLAARATIHGAHVTGLVTGLAADGALLLRDDTGDVHEVRSGDVEMIRDAAVL